MFRVICDYHTNQFTATILVEVFSIEHNLKVFEKSKGTKRKNSRHEASWWWQQQTPKGKWIIEFKNEKEKKKSGLKIDQKQQMEEK